MLSNFLSKIVPFMR